MPRRVGAIVGVPTGNSRGAIGINGIAALLPSLLHFPPISGSIQVIAIHSKWSGSMSLNKRNIVINRVTRSYASTISSAAKAREEIKTEAGTKIKARAGTAIIEASSD